eukprot:CAMPEP_0172604160 /NCGR_PEP_ID=MMETSP1068-20121228/24399_1 /TAXON_ID=35684 /ORGANISM="Pseudopedinella elastica, Strain CCMP716" /LENGTH=470 /DNA_ID=CAMNT_0013406113 /DNA_START=67 /DNA_END=1479 /DNA_ORIENTATION=-
MSHLVSQGSGALEYLRCPVGSRFHESSTAEEREAVSEALLDTNDLDFKRVLSPMLAYIHCQEALVLLLRNTTRFREGITPEVKQAFSALLRDLKALPEYKKSEKILQRHEPWIEKVRDQIAGPSPGVSGAKRVVTCSEVAEMVELGEKMKATGNASFQENNFKMAVVRYAQVQQLLKGACAVKTEDQSQLETLRKVATRNLSIAALKNWEWTRAAKACDEVLELDPSDSVVRLRRVEALMQLGRFDAAEIDIEAILKQQDKISKQAGEFGTKSETTTVVRKAWRLAKCLKKEKMRSDREMGNAVAKGMARGAFRDQRGVKEREISPSSQSESSSEDEKSESKEADCESSACVAAPAAKPAAKPRRLDLAMVRAVQAAQVDLWGAAEVISELNKMRIDADFEQQRFLYRLRPLKLHVQRPILEAHGFETTEAGLAQLERAIAAHMVDAPEVGEEMKGLMRRIMGDIWEEGE